VDQGAGVQHLERRAGAQEGVIVGDVGRHRAVAPPAEGGAEPLAARHAAAGLLEQVRGVRAQGCEPLAHLVEELVEHLLQALPELRALG
jgi:hypothetical protein